jgi:uncharacterized glyoxalase superfamily protein PhnB
MPHLYPRGVATDDHDVADLPYPTITPYLYYQDAAAAIDWLHRAFGFTERRRITASDGSVAHGEMAVGENGVIMFGSAGAEYESPHRREAVPSSLYVGIDDPDAHADRARQAGAQILEGPVDRPWGDREYVVADLEGHHWVFWMRRRPG